MKPYVKNILCYLVALLGLLAFISMFSSPLKSFDDIKGTWNVFNVRAYLGETSGGKTIYKGTIVPVFGFVIPLVCAIILIIESFKPSWGKNIKGINTFMAVIFLFCALAVLLTKELFLYVNDYVETDNLRNGSGPIFSALCSTAASIILLLVTWFPSKTPIKFIEK